jgi:competence protein ComEA
MSSSEPAPRVPPGVSSAAAGPSLRVRVGVGAAIVLVVGALVASVLVTALTPVGATTVVSDARPAPASPSETASGGTGTDTGSGGSGAAPPPSPAASGAVGLAEQGAVLLVHVLGAVVDPGVYELDDGSRVVDAVAAAGGLLPTADAGSVNLARPLADGEQLRVLAVGEAPPVGAPPPAAGGGGPPGAVAAAGAPVNLNAASEIDLDALPRIGPAMASRIVEYRTANGPFTAVDDLLQVPGIGEKTLEGLRPLVTV